MWLAEEYRRIFVGLSRVAVAVMTRRTIDLCATANVSDNIKRVDDEHSDGNEERTKDDRVLCGRKW